MQSPVAFQTVPDDPVSKRTETVGRVQPHVCAKLVDTDGNVVPLNTPGEICVSGYLVQKGFVHAVNISLLCAQTIRRYWKDDEQTKSAMKVHNDERLWMHTGDIGVLDEEGYLKGRFCILSTKKSLVDSLSSVVGRIKDIIIRGGEVSAL